MQQLTTSPAVGAAGPAGAAAPACAAPFAHSSGPRTARIALVGEAFGSQEHLTGLPFQGSAGQELSRLLTEAGIPRRDCFLTNVFAFQPLGNQIESLCCDTKTLRAISPNYPLPPLIPPGKWVKPEYLPELDRLYLELDTVQPNLVVALGNTACWALLGTTKISANRGAIALSRAEGPRKLKTLATYHPAAVLRQWSLRPVLVADLMKAKRELEFPEIRRPERWVLINPTIPEIVEWFSRPAKLYAVDIETSSKQITMIGFARSQSDAIVIPFFDSAKPHGSYWNYVSDEIRAWELVDEALASPIPKLFQNGLYDLSYLWRAGFRPKNCHHDTMLLHHSLFPEMQKGLGFMGSIYTNESAWKLLRHEESLKADE